MGKLKKKTHEMTDKELLKELFPKEVIKHLRQVAVAARKKRKK